MPGWLSDTDSPPSLLGTVRLLATAATAPPGELAPIVLVLSLPVSDVSVVTRSERCRGEERMRRRDGMNPRSNPPGLENKAAGKVPKKISKQVALPEVRC